MLRESLLSLRACAVTFLLCAIAYPAVVWGLAQLLFPAQAEGSLIFGPDGWTVVGSELIAQKFTSDRYFHPRPSAVDYKADAGGGSNMGPNHPELRQAVAARATASGATPEAPVPADLVTASGSGLDPDISPESALYQAERVARARGLAQEEVRDFIKSHVNTLGAMVGAPLRVNVLTLNIALDQQYPASRR